MPTCFKFGGYSVYFWSNEDGEPIHVHVSKGKPSEYATKIWLTRKGGLVLERNTSRIPDNDLSRIQEAIILNRKMIVSQWYERFGYVNYIDSNGSSQQLNIGH